MKNSNPGPVTLTPPPVQDVVVTGAQLLNNPWFDDLRQDHEDIDTWSVKKCAQMAQHCELAGMKYRQFALLLATIHNARPVSGVEGN